MGNFEGTNSPSQNNLANTIFFAQQIDALGNAETKDALDYIYTLTDHSISVRKNTRFIILMDEEVRERSLADLELPKFLQIAALLHDVGHFNMEKFHGKVDVTKPRLRDHGTIGFDIAKDNGIIDQRVLFTIRYHEIRDNAKIDEIIDSHEFKAEFGLVDVDGIKFFLKVIRDANRVDLLEKFVYNELYLPFKKPEWRENTITTEPNNGIIESFIRGDVIAETKENTTTHFDRLLVNTSMIMDINLRGSLEIILKNYKYHQFFSQMLRKYSSDSMLIEALENAFNRNIITKVF